MLLLFTILVCIGFASSQLQCNEKSFMQCQNKFADALRIDRSYNWNNPIDLMTAVQDIYILGTPDSQSGLIAVCKAFNDLIKCITQANLDANVCLSARWLLHSDNEPDKAYPYAMLMKQIRWQCSAGFYPAYDNWNCIKSTYSGRNATLLQCLNSFRANANEAPSNEKCKYAAIGKICYQKPFYETCPHSMAVANYGCESFRQYVLAEYPQCTGYCEVALILVVTVNAQTQTIGCDSAQFNRCTLQLAEHIGYPLQQSNVWLDAKIFNEILEQRYRQADDMSGVAYICNGLQIFYGCLGRYIDSCMSLGGLTLVKQLDPYSAYAYLGYLRKWRFQCGAGFYAVEKTGSLSCIQNTMKNQYQQLNALVDKYRADVDHDPSHACQYAAVLETAFRAVFAHGKCQSGGHGPLAEWWACEGQKEYTEAQFLECSHVNKCDYTVAQNTLKEFVKFVNGKMMVKIGPTWKRTENGGWYQEPEEWI